MRQAVICVLSIVFLLMAAMPVGYTAMAADGLANTPWPMFRHDLQHTGRSPYVGPSSPTLKWSYATWSSIYSSPAISADGTIYVGSLGDKLYAFNPDGSLKWSYATRWWVNSSPAIGSDGTIYFGSWGYLFALNPDGSLKWSSSTEVVFADSSPAIGSDGTIYFGSPDGKLRAFNPDGSLKWLSYTRGVRILSSPAIGADGTIYFGAGDGKLYALNPDGTLKWSYTTGGEVFSSPAIDSGGTIYFGSRDNELRALNPDGTLKWSYTTGDWVDSSPAIGSDGTIYFGSGDGKLYALERDTTPPAAPSLLSPTDRAKLNNNTLALDWSDVSDPSGVTYSLQVDDNSDFSSPLISQTGLSASSYTTSTLAEGTYYWRVKGIDGAGYESGWTTAWSFSVDITPPPIPSLISPANGATSNTATLTFDWSDVSDPSGVSYSLQVDNDPNFSSPILTKTGLTSSAYTLAEGEALSEGIYYWKVKAADGAGNESAWATAWSFIIDTTAPNLPSNPRKTTPDNDHTPTFIWDAVADAVSYEVRIDTGDYTPISNVTTYEHAAPLFDGSYIFSVRAKDGAGNVSAAESLSFMVDITPPTAPSNIARTTPGNDNTPAFAWTAVTDATSGVASYEVKIDTGSWIEIGNVTTYTYTTALSDGSHTFSVRARDEAGNTGSEVNKEFTIDTTAPNLPTNLRKTTPDNDNTPSFSWDAVADAVSYEVNIDTGSFVNIGNVTTYTVPSPLSEGAHTFSVRAKDEAGNVGEQASLSFDIKVGGFPLLPLLIGVLAVISISLYLMIQRRRAARS